MISSFLFLGCLVGILNGANIYLKNKKVDQLDTQLDQYSAVKYLNKSNLENERSSLLLRTIRGVKRCNNYRTAFNNSFLDCRVYPWKIECYQRCNWGHSFRNHKKSRRRRIKCYHRNGIWRHKGRRIPKKARDCIQRVNCQIVFKKIGNKECIYPPNMPPVCKIQCGGGKIRKHTCTAKGRWKPKLPPCVGRKKKLKKSRKAVRPKNRGKWRRTTAPNDGNKYENMEYSTLESVNHEDIHPGSEHDELPNTMTYPEGHEDSTDGIEHEEVTTIYPIGNEDSSDGIEHEGEHLTEEMAHDDEIVTHGISTDLNFGDHNE